MNSYLIILSIILLSSFFIGLNTQGLSENIVTSKTSSPMAENDQITNTAKIANQQVSKTQKPISVSQKKLNFFNMMMPHIKVANTEVLEQRQQLLVLQQQKSFSPSDLEFLNKMAKTYRAKESNDPQEVIKQLLFKVNTIPPSLILAQAANESAWGTSRFAKEANNYFGQWCFSKGCGIVPANRNAGAKHEVAKFDSVLGSVKGYIKNLNRHFGYQELRQLRQNAIDNNQPYSGITLAPGLIRYSERGEEYVKEITAMIRYNKLVQYDK